MFYVYILKSKVDRKLYKGMTQNIKIRFKQHNLGMVKSTKAYVSWDWFIMRNSIQE